MELLQHLAQSRSAEYMIALAGLFLFMGFWRLLNGPKRVTEHSKPAVPELSRHVSGFRVPGNVFYHPGHAWARIESPGVLTIGMDDFSGKLIGRMDSISLPSVGNFMRQGTNGWSIEADSKVIEMLAPVTGEVVEVNEAIRRNPDLVLEDPYDSGWLFKVRHSEVATSLRNMVPPEMAGDWIAKLRQRLTGMVSPPALVSLPLMQDGGLPVEGVAKAIDPARWETIVSDFLMTGQESINNQMES